MATFKAVGHIVDIVPAGPGPALVCYVKEGPLTGQKIIIENKEFIWRLVKALTGNEPEVHGREHTKWELLRSKTQVDILKNTKMTIIFESKQPFD